jgi:hypothetical protein
LSADIRKISLGFLTLEFVDTNKSVLADERELAAIKLKPATSHLLPKAPVLKTSALTLNVFKQEITSPAPLQTLKVDEKATMKVTVKNIGNEPWPNKGSDEKSTNRVGLGFHWIDSTGKAIEEGRTMLPNPLMSGSSVTLDVNVHAPSKPGDYTLRFSMVQEHVVWFHDKGAAPFIVKIKVKSK